MDGKGKLSDENGETYEGDFQNNKKHGKGIYLFSKNSPNICYNGHWKNDMKSGKGNLVLKNGSKYEGDFENDLFNGFGIYYYKEDIRDYYEGHWKDGMKSGKGI
jgi:hypothetical protein